MDNEELKEEQKETEEKKSNKNEKKDHKDNSKKKIEELQNEINELKDKNMRVTAEMINTVRRKDEETSRLLKYSNESLILEILPVIDNFERALSQNSDSEDILNYQKGMSMIYNNLLINMKLKKLNV